MSKKTRKVAKPKASMSQADLLMVRSLAKGIEALGRELVAWCDRKLEVARMA